MCFICIAFSNGLILSYISNCAQCADRNGSSRNSSLYRLFFFPNLDFWLNKYFIPTKNIQIPKQSQVQMVKLLIIGSILTIFSTALHVENWQFKLLRKVIVTRFALKTDCELLLFIFKITEKCILWLPKKTLNYCKTPLHTSDLVGLYTSFTS